VVRSDDVVFRFKFFAVQSRLDDRISVCVGLLVKKINKGGAFKGQYFEVIGLMDDGILFHRKAQRRKRGFDV
jgi:hypothetical protein